MSRTLMLATLAVALSSSASAQLPERVVTGNTLRSERDPSIVLELREPATYVGADRWVLYGVADCEIHVFVEAGPDRKVSRLYWIQFEGYLPGVSAAYNGYTSPTRASIGGREFIVDGFLFRPGTPYSRPDSDRERVIKLLASKGYVLPEAMMMRRMVHLPTADRRKELMIIYAEDLAPAGYAAADLAAGGKSESERPRLEQELLDRAVARITARQ